MGSSGGKAATPAGGMSLASVGLSAYSDILKSEGTASADEFQATKLEEASTYGALKATQTSGQMSRQLNQTLGNIDAVRAAARTDPNSPTGSAFRQNQEDIGTDQRTITVNSLMQQSRQDSADAQYYQSAASDALFGGFVSAAGDVAKAAAPLLVGL